MFYVTLAGECERENVEHDKTAKDVDEPWRQLHSSAVAVVGGGRGKSNYFVIKQDSPLAFELAFIFAET